MKVELINGKLYREVDRKDIQSKIEKLKAIIQEVEKLEKLEKEK